MMNYILCLNDRSFTIVHETSSIHNLIALIQKLTGLQKMEVVEEMKEAISDMRCANFTRYDVKAGKQVYSYVVDFEKIEA